MSYSISNLLTRDLHDVFGENDPAGRRAAVDEIFSEDCVVYQLGGVYRGRDAIDRVAGAIKATHPDFRYQPMAEPEEIRPAMPADTLESTDLTRAHPFGQLKSYQNLRVLTTVSKWDTPLARFYPVQEAQRPADPVYATAPAGTRQDVPALGGTGPTNRHLAGVERRVAPKSPRRGAGVSVHRCPAIRRAATRRCGFEPAHTATRTWHDRRASCRYLDGLSGTIWPTWVITPISLAGKSTGS